MLKVVRGLIAAILRLADELCNSTAQREREFVWFQSRHGLVTKKDLDEWGKKIMATQAELVADLKTVVAQLQKLDGDTRVLQQSVDAANAKIAELEAIIAQGGTIGQELIDAVAEVKAAVQVVDDNVPEVPAPPVPA